MCLCLRGTVAIVYYYNYNYHMLRVCQRLKICTQLITKVHTHPQFASFARLKLNNTNKTGKCKETHVAWIYLCKCRPASPWE